MGATNTIQLTIQLDSQGANKGIRETNQGLVGFERSAQQAAVGASRAIEGFERSASRAAVTINQRFSVLSGVLGANALQGLVGQAQQLAQGGVLIAGSFERSRIGLEAFLGSAEKARGIFADIQDFAQRSPFQFKDLAQGANRLLAFNFEAEKLLPTLSAISSATGALGGDLGKFNDLITAFGQIRQAGKLTGEELRQLRNAGVEGIVIEALGKAYGKTAAEIQKAVRDGIIPGAQAVEISIAALEARFGPFNDKVSKSFEVALSNVGDALGKLADTGLGPLLPKITAFLNGLQPQFESFGRFLARNSDSISSWITVFGQLATAVAISQVPMLLRNIVGSVQAVSVALAANPFGLAALGLGAFAFAAIRARDAMSELAETRKQLNAQEFVKARLDEGKSIQQVAIELNKFKQLSGDRSRFSQDLDQVVSDTADVEAVVARLGITVKKNTSAYIENAAGIRLVTEEQKQQRKLEFAANAEKEQERIKSAESRASDLLRQSTEKNLEGLARIRFELQQNLKEYGLTKKAIEDLKAASNLEGVSVLRKEAIDALKEYGKEVERQNDTFFKIRQDQAAEYGKNNAEAFTSALQANIEVQDAIADQELRSLEFRRNREIASLEAAGAFTVDQKVAVELRKAEVEKQFLEQSEKLKIDQFERLALRELEADEAKFQRKELSEQAFLARVEATELKILQQRNLTREETLAGINAATDRANVASVSLARDNAEKTFSQVKRSVDGVFDQVVTRSRSVFDAVGNIAKTALLSAIKEVTTSRIALALVGMLSGNRAAQGPNFGTGGGFGGLLRLAGLGGSLGAFALPGAPGGTGGFAGPVSAANLGSLGALPTIIGANGQPLRIGGGGGGLGSLALGGAGLSSLFFNSGSIALGGGAATTAAGIGGIGGGLAGIASSTAGLLGGGLLALQGIRRGGLLGSALGAGGGALAGFALGAKIGAIGGPVGALIGAAVGGGAALIRSLFKSGTEKAREKIKSIYGVDISARSVLDQVVGLAKQSYGGNLDVAVRSKDVQDLVELYALSTGQSARGIAARQQPVTLSTSGGVTGILSNYVNGQAVNPVSVNQPGPTVINVTLDQASSAAFLQGQTVQAIESNPRTVAAANGVAQQSNFGRQQAAVTQISPGLLLA
jgi:tape measure domain-containing protein